MVMRILNWNTEWAKPGTGRADRVAARIAEHSPDIACLTEAYPGILREEGHTLFSTDDSGYQNEGGRRKVILWSRESRRDCYHAEETGLPGGRFVSDVTAGIRIVGLCIPWSMAHVTTGRRDRRPWEDHLTFLKSLHPILSGFLSRPEPLLVTGDWNQRIPRTYQPQKAYDALIQTLAGLKVVTSGYLPEVGELLIDHLAVSPALQTTSLRILPARDNDGKRLSDHIGYSLDILPSAS